MKKDKDWTGLLHICGFQDLSSTITTSYFDNWWSGYVAKIFHKPVAEGHSGILFWKNWQDEWEEPTHDSKGENFGEEESWLWIHSARGWSKLKESQK